jgi:hypothetical protein
MPEPFPALACAGRSLAHLKAHGRDAIRLGWPWYGGALLVALLTPSGVAGELALRLLTFLAAAVLAAAWSRHVLLGERRPGPARFDRAALKVLGWNLMLGLIVAIPPGAAAAVAPVSGPAGPFLVAALVLVALWVAARLALALPLAAGGEGIGAAARAWLVSARAGWRLPLGWIALLLVLFALGFVAFGVIGSIEAVFRDAGSDPDPRVARAAGVLLQWVAVPALIGYAAFALRALGVTSPEAAGPTPAVSAAPESR